MKKINRLKTLGLFLGLALLTPILALAELVTLTCVSDGSTGSKGTFQLVLDEDAKTAAFAQNPVSPAVFTAATVKWKVDLTRDNYHLQLFYRFDRQSRVLTQTFLSMTSPDGKEKHSHGTNTYRFPAAQ